MIVRSFDELTSIDLRVNSAMYFLSSSWLSPNKVVAQSLTSMIYSLSSLPTTASTEHISMPPNIREIWNQSNGIVQVSISIKKWSHRNYKKICYSSNKIRKTQNEHLIIFCQNCSLLNHHLMANICEKAVSISAGNLNSGFSYFITTVRSNKITKTWIQIFCHYWL